MSGETFTCAACKNSFVKVLSDDEAMAETADQVRGTPEDGVFLCEACYERVLVELRSLRACVACGHSWHGHHGDTGDFCRQCSCSEYIGPATGGPQ